MTDAPPPRSARPEAGVAVQPAAGVGVGVRPEAGVGVGVRPEAGVGASPAGRPDEDRSFEQLLAELESITDRLAGGELGIEAAADLYERAERLHRLARARLDAVHERVERLRQPPAT